MLKAFPSTDPVKNAVYQAAVDGLLSKKGRLNLAQLCLDFNRLYGQSLNLLGQPIVLKHSDLRENSLLQHLLAQQMLFAMPLSEYLRYNLFYLQNINLSPWIILFKAIGIYDVDAAVRRYMCSQLHMKSSAIVSNQLGLQSESCEFDISYVHGEEDSNSRLHISLPGEVKTQLVLTEDGWRYKQVDCSNALLEGMTLTLDLPFEIDGSAKITRDSLANAWADELTELKSLLQRRHQAMPEGSEWGSVFGTILAGLPEHIYPVRFDLLLPDHGQADGGESHHYDSYSLQLSFHNVLARQLLRLSKDPFDYDALKILMTKLYEIFPATDNADDHEMTLEEQATLVPYQQGFVVLLKHYKTMLDQDESSSDSLTAIKKIAAMQLENAIELLENMISEKRIYQGYYECPVHFAIHVLFATRNLMTWQENPDDLRLALQALSYILVFYDVKFAQGIIADLIRNMLELAAIQHRQAREHIAGKLGEPAETRQKSDVETLHLMLFDTGFMQNIAKLETLINPAERLRLYCKLVERLHARKPFSLAFYALLKTSIEGDEVISAAQKACLNICSSEFNKSRMTMAEFETEACPSVFTVLALLESLHDLPAFFVDFDAFSQIDALMDAISDDEIVPRVKNVLRVHLKTLAQNSFEVELQQLVKTKPNLITELERQLQARYLDRYTSRTALFHTRTPIAKSFISLLRQAREEEGSSEHLIKILKLSYAFYDFLPEGSELRQIIIDYLHSRSNEMIRHFATPQVASSLSKRGPGIRDKLTPFLSDWFAHYDAHLKAALEPHFMNLHQAVSTKSLTGLTSMLVDPDHERKVRDEVESIYHQCIQAL